MEIAAALLPWLGLSFPGFCCLDPVSEPGGDPPPKLVVHITVDQLRGDVPVRMRHRFPPGGFRRLFDGLHYANAHFRHATTYTAAGHATLFTGADPRQHGLVGNNWRDRRTGERVYCVEDPNYVWVGTSTRKEHAGTSPANLLVNTYGDELVLSNGGRSRVFSVSIKDRGAILPAGRRGKAFWYDSQTGRFVSSTYYFESLPSWAEEWNQAGKAEAYRDQAWELSRPRASYLWGEQDDREAERPFRHMGKTFPHPLAGKEPQDLFAALPFSPMGDALTLDFARELVRRERLGSSDATDLLAISLSATDYIGHAWGPNSLEAEDQLLRLDRQLAALFDFLDREIGLSRILIVLSADHGVDASPEFRNQSAGRTDLAGRHQPQQFLDVGNQALRKHFSLQAEENLVVAFWNPGLYFDETRIRALKLNLKEAEDVVAKAVASLPGIEVALSHHRLLAGEEQTNPEVGMMARSFHARRSGNVLLIQTPFWYLYHRPQRYAAMHGSPYRYDTHVPIFLLGPGIASRTVYRRVGPESLAATLAGYLALPWPSAADSTLLKEVFPAGNQSWLPDR